MKITGEVVDEIPSICQKLKGKKTIAFQGGGQDKIY